MKRTASRNLPYQPKSAKQETESFFMTKTALVQPSCLAEERFYSTLYSAVSPITDALERGVQPQGQQDLRVGRRAAHLPFHSHNRLIQCPQESLGAMMHP